MFHCLFLILLLLCPLPAATAATSPDAPPRILFIGNSLSAANGGVDQQVAKLAGSALRPRQLQVEGAYQDGATLRALWNMPGLQGRIRQGQYSIVIMQEDLPETSPATGVAEFKEYVNRFVLQARRAHARPLLFLAWPYERLNWMSGDAMAQAHRAVGAELDIVVAPVGPAFRRARRERPGLALLGPDGEHPTPQGTYLAAAVIHATLYGDLPENLSWQPASISAADALFLRRIAADTSREWRR